MENKDEIIPIGGNFLILLLIMILLIAFLCLFCGSYFFGFALIILLIIIVLFFCFISRWKDCIGSFWDKCQGMFEHSTLENFSFSENDRKRVEKHLSKRKYRLIKI
jgi:hypothetical protein